MLVLKRCWCRCWEETQISRRADFVTILEHLHLVSPQCLCSPSSSPSSPPPSAAPVGQCTQLFPCRLRPGNMMPLLVWCFVTEENQNQAEHVFFLTLHFKKKVNSLLWCFFSPGSHTLLFVCHLKCRVSTADLWAGRMISFPGSVTRW